MKKFKNKTIKRIIATVSAIAMTAVSVPAFGTGMAVEAATSGANFDEKNIAMSFAVMTDLHLHQGSNSSAEAVQRQVQRYANTVATLNHMAKANSGEGLDLLMLTGDYCDVGSKVQATAFATATSQILAELDEVNGKETGFIMAYGNHETEAQGRDNGTVVNQHMTYEEWEDVLNQYGLEATAKDENDEYVPWGCNHETVVKDGKTYHFFSLEIYSYVSPTNMILNEALEWLDAELAEVTANDPDAYVYFACHGPTQESGVYGADMNFDVNAWWGAAKSGVDGWTYASDAQYSPQKATSGDLDDVLKKYPQVVHFSGHYHYSNILESSIMQKNYTAVALSALSDSSLGSAGNNGYYDGLTNMTENNLYNGYALLVEVDEDGNQRITRVKMDTTYSNVLDATITYMDDDASTTPLYKSDGTTVIEHRDERKNATNVEFSDTIVATPNTLEPWVMNAPTSDNSHLKKYSQESRKGTPVFPEGATLEIANIVKGSDDSVTFDVIFDTVGAKTTDTNYVIRYELELYNQDGKLLKAGKTYTANASAGKAQTETIWFIGNWASSKNGVVAGSGTTHLDATKLSYNIALTSAQLAGATGIYAKLYAVDEFGGKSEALTYGSKLQMVNVAHAIKNGGFEKGDMTNWSDGTTAEPIPETPSVKITGISQLAVYSGDLAGLAELFFITDGSWKTTSTKTSGKNIQINGNNVSTDITAENGNQLAMATWGAGAMDNGNVVTIPAGLQFKDGDTVYEVAETFSFKYTKGSAPTNGTYEIVEVEEVEPTGPIRVVTEPVQSGNYSLKIEREDTAKKIVRTDINSISSETEYKLSYHINTDVSATVEATVYEYSFNNKIVGMHQTEIYGSTDGWKKAELPFTTSAGADKLGLILTVKGSKGVVYIDDIVLEAQGAETIQFSYDDSNGDSAFDMKDIVRMKKAQKNGKDTLATPKYADRNGDGTFDELDIVALRSKALGLADDFTNVLVTSGDIEAFGAKLQSDVKTPYMATGKKYTNESFTFTSEYVADGKMAVGVRMQEPNNGKGDATGKGVIIGFYGQKGFVEFYGGSWGNQIGATFLNLIPGETYLFSAQMTNKEDGTAELYFEARQDSVVVSSFTHTFDAETVAAYIPSEGQFAVWAQEPCQEVLYQVIPTEHPTELIVDAESGREGIVNLKKHETAGMGYIVLDGDYTTDIFKVTTTLTEGDGYDLLLGAHMTGNDRNWQKHPGIVFDIRETGLTVYCVDSAKHAANNQVYRAQSVFSWTLETNVEYTFVIQIDPSAGVGTIQVIQDNKVVQSRTGIFWNLSGDTGCAPHISQSGDFMVWSAVDERRIAWNMPEKDTSVAEIDASTAGTVFVTTNKPGDIANSAYVATKATYTTEAMEFTTVLESINTIALGIRMQAKDHNPAAQNGLYIQFAEDGSTYNVCSKGAVVATGTLATALEAGREYTFRMSINGTKLRLDIYHEGTNIHYAILDVSKATIPASGYFMVWSMDARHTVEYNQVIEGGHTKVVTSDGKPGTYVLNGIKTGDSPYLVMDGEYTTEMFTFTTMFGSGINIGMHMTVNDGNWAHGPGIVITVGSQSIAVYCANTVAEGNEKTYGHSTQSVYNFATALSADQEYTFDVSFDYVNNKILLVVRQGNTVINTINGSLWYYADHKEHVPAAGDFMVWSNEEGRKISYEIPTDRPTKMVTSETSGTITLENYTHVNAGRNYGYLAVNAEHTIEKFKVTTTFDKELVNSMYIGMRMADNSLDPLAMDGFVFQISNWGIAAYCTGGTCANTNLGSKSISLNKANVEYTFEVWMSDDVIYMDVYRGGAKSSFSWDTTTLLDGVHKSHIPTTGEFMVWSVDDTQTFEYEVTVDTTIVNVDADTAAGTALLVSNKPGDLENSAYLVTKDTYTTEIIEFTTVLQEVDTMIFGARMAGKSNNPANYHGLYVQFTEDGTGYTVYNKGESVATGTLETALEAGKEYTFRLMADKTFGLVIRQGDTEIHNASIALTNVANVPAEGYFMVWSMDAQHSVSYSTAMTGGGSVVIPEGSEDGAAIVYGKSALASGEKLSVELDGNYTTETASFTLTFSEKTDHYIGARMTDVQAKPTSSKGVVVKIGSGGPAYIYVNGTQLTKSHWTADTTHGRNDAWYYSGRKAGTYTYTIEVQNFGDTSKVVVREIGPDGVAWIRYSPEFASSLLPESGSFAVWTSDDGKVEYTKPTNSHVVVDANSMTGESETVSLQAETMHNSTGTSENWSAFLEMDGVYTTEVFEFSTVIDNPANPQLVIGAHMTHPNAQWSAGTGIRLKFADYGLALYGHNSYNWPAYSKSWKNVFTNTDPYDFVLQVQTDAEGYMTILLDIKQDGKTVWSFNSATAINGQGVALGKVKTDVKGNAMNTSGSFVVWSWNESQTITYKKPYELTAE